MKFRSTRRIVLPRTSGGTDWSTQRRVILDAGEKHGRVWWWPGATEWARLGCFTYRPASLEVEHDAEFGRTHDTLLEGGRLSIQRLADPELRRKIAELLKMPVDNLPRLDPQRCWVLDDRKMGS